MGENREEVSSVRKWQTLPPPVGSLSLIDTFKGSLPLKLKIPPGGKLVYTLLLKKIAEV